MPQNMPCSWCWENGSQCKTFRSAQLNASGMLLLQKKRVYLTGKQIAILFCKSVKAIHPQTSKANLSRYSAHSLRVWACVLLDEAGMSPEFIMSHLCWMGNSFWMYLRNTGIIQDKHCDILRAASQEVINLIAGSSVNTPNPVGMSTVEADNIMGNYTYHMD